MPRYHFHIHDRAETWDEEGQDLANEDEARACALESARELICDDVHHGHLNLGHYIEVTKGRSETLFRLTFGEAFTLTP